MANVIKHSPIVPVETELRGHPVVVFFLVKYSTFQMPTFTFILVKACSTTVRGKYLGQFDSSSSAMFTVPTGTGSIQQGYVRLCVFTVKETPR